MSTCHWSADNIYSVHSYPKGMSFLSNFTYSKLMQTETMMNEFTIKVSTFKELSEEQIEQLIDKIFDNDPNIFYAERSDKM